MYLDLDRFRNINNTLGHAIGDKLLQQFSQRIHSLLSDTSLFCRFGGDEFGIVLWDYEQSDYPESIAKTIIDCLNEPFMIEDFELFITASIGISTYPSMEQRLRKSLRMLMQHCTEQRQVEKIIIKFILQH